jgi:hypothetical protein
MNMSNTPVGKEFKLSDTWRANACRERLEQLEEALDGGMFVRAPIENEITRLRKELADMGVKV